MRRLTVLHYLTQWMWLSDSFVHGPVSRSKHGVVAVTRLPLINDHVYPPPSNLHQLTEDGNAPAEGSETAGKVLRFLEGTRPDVVHLHHGYGLRDAASIATALGVPLVASFWGCDVTALPAKEPERILPHIAMPDVALVPSRFLASRVRTLGVPAERVRVMPGSVDTRFFTPTPLPAGPEVAFVGRFVAKKGIDTLLRAWPLVRDAIPAAALTLLGYGDPPPARDEVRGLRILMPDPADPRRQVRDSSAAVACTYHPARQGPTAIRSGTCQAE